MVRALTTLAVFPLLALLACSGCVDPHRVHSLKSDLEVAQADQRRLEEENRQLAARIEALENPRGAARANTPKSQDVPAGADLGSSGPERSSDRPVEPSPAFPASPASPGAPALSVNPQPETQPEALPDTLQDKQSEAQPVTQQEQEPAPDQTMSSPQGDEFRPSAQASDKALGHPKTAVPPIPPDQATRDEYAQAVQLATEGKTEQARTMLSSLMSRFPNSTLMPNFFYWTGESLYRDRRYGEAVLAFKEVHQRYPKSAKAPDALLMAGQAFERLGDKDSARLYFQALVEEYPDTRAAEIAGSKLGRPGN